MFERGEVVACKVRLHLVAFFSAASTEPHDTTYLIN
jgi:hypothetical protein